MSGNKVFPTDKAATSDKVSIIIELRVEHNRELQLMDVLDQVMERYHGIGIGVPLVDGAETRRALSRFNEKWMPEIQAREER